jgi:histone H3/H4
MGHQRKTTIISKAPATRMLMNAGAKRVSDDGAAAFSEVIYERARKIAEQSVLIAKHSGRKTVLDEDIKLAVRK